MLTIDHPELNPELPPSTMVSMAETKTAIRLTEQVKAAG
jgi:hypothetical protein